MITHIGATPKGVLVMVTKDGEDFWPTDHVEVARIIVRVGLSGEATVNIPDEQVELKLVLAQGLDLSRQEGIR